MVNEKLMAGAPPTEGPHRISGGTSIPLSLSGSAPMHALEGEQQVKKDDKLNIGNLENTLVEATNKVWESIVREAQQQQLNYICGGDVVCYPLVVWEWRQDAARGRLELLHLDPGALCPRAVNATTAIGARPAALALSARASPQGSPNISMCMCPTPTISLRSGRGSSRSEAEIKKRRVTTTPNTFFRKADAVQREGDPSEFRRGEIPEDYEREGRGGMGVRQKRS